MKKHAVYIFLSVLAFISCRKDEPVPDRTATYLHISHTRQDQNPALDSIAEQIDYAKYDMLWLGGDLAYLTSVDDATIEYVDAIFNLKKLTTLWALGNHDYSDLSRISTHTGRPNFYAYYQNNITFLVLDTQDSLSHITWPQQQLIDQVLDTLTHSNYLILLHHKLIWMADHEALAPIADDISNGHLGACSYCINPNNFYTYLYPKLLDVKGQGIQVLCIGGDIGSKAKSFEYVTDEGIYLLASGIKSGKPSNKGLVFQHHLSTGVLTWSFEPLESL